MLKDNKETPRKTKTKAVFKAMRPGKIVNKAGAVSVKNKLSMPKLKPEKYSKIVIAPISMAATALPYPKYRVQCFNLFSCKNHKAVPKKIKPIAVFGFMVTKLAETLFKTAKLNSQPIKTKTPIKKTALLTAAEKILALRTNLGSVSVFLHSGDSPNVDSSSSIYTLGNYRRYR